jgi:penicillin-binding protein 1A
MVSMMKDVVQRGTAYNSVWQAGFQYPAGGKTGTTNDGTNVWFIGYTSDLVAGVWLGNDDGSPTKKVTGGSIPVAVWSQFMRTAEQGATPSALPGGSSGLFSNLGGFGSSPAPTPPGAIPNGTPAKTQQSRGLDGWLLDSLFGR